MPAATSSTSHPPLRLAAFRAICQNTLSQAKSRVTRPRRAVHHTDPKHQPRTHQHKLLQLGQAQLGPSSSAASATLGCSQRRLLPAVQGSLAVPGGVRQGSCRARLAVLAVSLPRPAEPVLLGTPAPHCSGWGTHSHTASQGPSLLELRQEERTRCTHRFRAPSQELCIGACPRDIPPSQSCWASGHGCPQPPAKPTHQQPGTLLNFCMSAKQGKFEQENAAAKTIPSTHASP